MASFTCLRLQAIAPPPRRLSVHRAVAKDPSVVLDQEVYAAWARENAVEQADQLYRLYPDAKLVWAGNDLMAFGAMAAWEKRGGKPGVDAWFSGINTSIEALEAIKMGRLTSLAGGHFIAGAWALFVLGLGAALYLLSWGPAVGRPR